MRDDKYTNIRKVSSSAPNVDKQPEWIRYLNFFGTPDGFETSRFRLSHPGPIAYVQIDSSDSSGGHDYRFAAELCYESFDGGVVPNEERGIDGVIQQREPLNIFRGFGQVEGLGRLDRPGEFKGLRYQFGGFSGAFRGRRDDYARPQALLCQETAHLGRVLPAALIERTSVVFHPVLRGARLCVAHD